MMSPQSLPETSEVVVFWKQVIATLHQRKLLRKAGDGFELPHADAFLLDDRCVFVLDMQRLGGISIEKWENEDLHRQLSAALKGRRVVVTSRNGLAIQISRQPQARSRRKLPTNIPLLASMELPTESYTVVLGQGNHGETVELDIARSHRAIITGGTSGGGKTNLMKSVVLQLAKKHTPDTFLVAIVDTKEVDFPAFEGLPHLFASIAYDLDEADELIKAVEVERLRRKTLLRAAGVSDWRDMPAGQEFPLLLLVVDEAADFKGRTAMDMLIQIARKGRAMGISILLGTQHPTVDVIDSQVKANLPIAIAFQTATISQSNTILDRAGAEKLNRPGLALSFLHGSWRVIQTLQVEQDTIKAIVGSHAVDLRQPILSEIEAALVSYAVDRLDGKFVIGKLYDAMRTGKIDGYIPKPQLEDLGKEWEAVGWLTAPEHATDPRKVTNELLSALSGDLSALSDRKKVPIRGDETLSGDKEAPVMGPVSENEALSAPISPVRNSGDQAQGAGPGELPPFMEGRHRAIEL